MGSQSQRNSTLKKKNSILDEMDDAGIKFIDGSDAQNAKIVQGLLDLV